MQYPAKFLTLVLSIILSVGIAIPLISSTPAAGTPAANPRLQAGDATADFRVIGPHGEEIRLSDYLGKVVVLDFWATWCAPCLKVMPYYNSMAAKHADDGLVVLSICVADSRENYMRWVQENPELSAIQTAHDPLEKRLRESIFSQLYGVSLLPSVFVVDRAGILLGRVKGSGESSNLQELLEQAGLNAKQPVPESVPLRESYGKTAAGSTLPDVLLQASDGSPVGLADLAAGGPLVIHVVSVNAPLSLNVDLLNAWSLRYAGQGVRMVAIAAYGSRQQFDDWQAAHGDQLRIPVLFDPAGTPPTPDKPRDELSDDEVIAFNAVRREHFSRVVPMVLAGGMMAPVPHTIVADAGLNLIGVFLGSGPHSRDGLANLLLRGGVTLAAADTPHHRYTPVKAAPPPEAVPLLQAGQQAPDFTAIAMDGSAVKLSDYRGKVVVLDFWASWCGPCMIAMPHVQALAAQYREQGVVVLGSATRDSREAFEKWIRANAARYPDIIWAHDPAGRSPDNASRALFGVGGIPTQFVINRDGTIADVVVGYLKGEVLLDAALAKAGIDVPAEILAKAELDARNRLRLQ